VNNRVSVVVETVTARHDRESAPVGADIDETLAALARQTYPHELTDIIVVVDDAVPADVQCDLQRRHPLVRIARAEAFNYFAAKNAGARAATGSIVALLDSDCVPDPDWLERLVGHFADGVSAVIGATRYTGRSLMARTMSVPDFGHVVRSGDGAASGLMLNNMAILREVLLQHPLDARIRRNGGCYLLYHQLRARGARITYEPAAKVHHGLDIAGFGFLRKHFDRGFDGVSVYRCDDEGVLRGTSLFRRFGAAILFPLTVRRIALDWLRLARERRQTGIHPAAVPFFAAIAAGTRAVELAGAFAAAFTDRA
jgi:cellulose synthase/poly-beta-1,6-N-acetylglucosamine synthase-like glycosyltransferase